MMFSNDLDVWALMAVLPHTLVMAVVPLLLYKALADDGPRRTLILVSLICGSLLLGCGGLTTLGFASAFSPGGGELLYERLVSGLSNPLTLIAFFAFVLGAPLLARRGCGELGLWMFAGATTCFSYWFGLAAIPSGQEMLRSVAFVILLGALTGDIIALFVLDVEPAAKKWRKLLFWAGGGTAAATLGALSGWLHGQQIAAANASWRDPLIIDPPATILVLVTTLVLGLVAAPLAAFLAALWRGKVLWLIPGLIVLALGWVGWVSALGPATVRPFKTLSTSGGYVHSVTFSPDGGLLAAGLGPDVVEEYAKQGNVLIWRRSDWTRVATLEAGVGEPDLSFSPDGRLLGVGSSGGTIMIYSTADWSLVQTLAGEVPKTGIVFSPDGETLVAAGGTTIRRWRVADWSELDSFSVAEVYDGEAMAISPDGTTIATGSSDWKIRIWNAETGALAAVLVGHSKEVTALAYSADGRFIGSTSWDDTVRVWRVADEALQQTFASASQNVAFSASSSMVAASGTWQSPQVWRTSDGVRQMYLRGEPGTDGTSPKVFSIAFSPDDTIIAGGSQYRKLYLWQLDQ